MFLFDCVLRHAVEPYRGVCVSWFPFILLRFRYFKVGFLPRANLSTGTHPSQIAAVWALPENLSVAVIRIHTLNDPHLISNN